MTPMTPADGLRDWFPDAVAEYAYRVADAMLAARAAK